MFMCPCCSTDVVDTVAFLLAQGAWSCDDPLPCLCVPVVVPYTVAFLLAQGADPDALYTGGNR